MRSLDEWHKYVEIQTKRVSSAKSGQPANSTTDEREIEAAESQAAQGNGYSALDDLYAEASYSPASFLPASSDESSNIVDSPAQEHLRPTPLPAMIEFAPDDLSMRTEPDLGELPSAFSPPIDAPAYTAPPERLREQQALPLDEHGTVLSPNEKSENGSRLPRNGRIANSAHKETREELLARLLDPELTLEEAAQVLNVCPTTVRRYTNRGVLPHYRTIGNQRRFRLSQVLAFLESQEMPHSQGSRNG